MLLLDTTRTITTMDMEMEMQHQDTTTTTIIITITTINAPTLAIKITFLPSANSLTVAVMKMPITVTKITITTTDMEMEMQQQDTPVTTTTIITITTITTQATEMLPTLLLDTIVLLPTMREIPVDAVDLNAVLRLLHLLLLLVSVEMLAAMNQVIQEQLELAEVILAPTLTVKLSRVARGKQLVQAQALDTPLDLLAETVEKITEDTKARSLNLMFELIY